MLSAPNDIPSIVNELLVLDALRLYHQSEDLAHTDSRPLWLQHGHGHIKCSSHMDVLLYHHTTLPTKQNIFDSRWRRLRLRRSTEYICLDPSPGNEFRNADVEPLRPRNTHDSARLSNLGPRRPMCVFFHLTRLGRKSREAELHRRGLRAAPASKRVPKTLARCARLHETYAPRASSAFW